MFEYNQVVFALQEIAMYWHKGHWVKISSTDWDRSYENKFNAALARATGRAIS